MNLWNQGELHWSDVYKRLYVILCFMVILIWKYSLKVNLSTLRYVSKSITVNDVHWMLMRITIETTKTCWTWHSKSKPDAIVWRDYFQCCQQPIFQVCRSGWVVCIKTKSAWSTWKSAQRIAQECRKRCQAEKGQVKREWSRDNWQSSCLTFWCRFGWRYCWFWWKHDTTCIGWTGSWLINTFDCFGGYPKEDEGIAWTTGKSHLGWNLLLLSHHHHHPIGPSWCTFFRTYYRWVYTHYRFNKGKSIHWNNK